MMAMTSSRERTEAGYAPVPSSTDELLTRLVFKFARSLGAVRSTTQALLNGADEDPGLRRDMLHGVDAELQELQRLIENVVQLRAFEKGVLHLKLRIVLPSLLLWRVVETWLSKEAANMFNWEIDIADELAPIRVDVDRLQQVVDNLLGNAMRHSQAGSRITVQARAEQHDLLFRVESDATTLSPEDYEHISELFYTGRQQGRFPVGTGLGLYVGRLLVREHGGALALTQAAGEGQRLAVTMRIPFVEVSQEQVM